ncbi:MAG TPA: ABC transporter permease [Terracidiphilus sp.]|nr:ABC transporter permease [Terracidiphilus sp.]
MRILANVAYLFRSFFRKRDLEREMDEELSGFVEASTADKLRRGLPAEQAARAARVEMGSTNAVKHRIRSVGWETQVEILWHDLLHGIRALGRSPGFTLIAVSSLALGIGGNTAIFTLINQVLLKSLPVRDPQQLVTFGKSTSSGILGGIDLGTADMFTYDFARQLEANPGPFQGVAAYSSISPKVNVRVPNSAAAIQIPATLVSGDFFQVLGATPFLGRAIAPFDADAPDRSAVAVVSYHFWQQSLSANPAILGKAITVNGTSFAVIGVMPEAFHGIKQEVQQADLWVPLTMVQEVFLQPNMLRPRDFYILHMFARRNPQTSLAADQTWLDRQIRDYVRAGEGGPIPPARQQDIERITVPLTSAAHGVSGLRNRYGDSLVILMAIVAVVLLIACANLANFLLARAVARQREIATRLALGSSRARIVGHSVVEALLLSLCGGLLGLLVALAVTRALIAFVARDALFTPLDPRPDGTVLLFTFAVSIAAGLLFGLAPAMHVARATAGAGLVTNSRTAQGSAGRSGRWWQKGLVTAQIMLCVSLLVGAGLFLRTLHNLQDQDFGFERSHMLIADFDARIAGYKPEQVPVLNQRLLDSLAAIPGVRSAALAATPPISSSSWTSSLSISGYRPNPKENMVAVLNRVSGDYFDAAGIPMFAGRAIQPSDSASTLKVAVVNQAFARHYFPNGDIIGRTLKIDIGEPGPWLIVGVARDTRSGNPREDAPRTVYMPLAQVAGPRGEGAQDSYAWVMILRTAGDPAQTIASLRAAVAGVDPNIPILHVRTIQDQLESFMSQETLISRLTATFAGLAILLAAIGLYGVMSFNVARRTGEIGIRIALGASGSGVQWMVLRESLGLLGAGLGLGLPIALYAVRLVRSELYDLSPFDPAIFIAATAGIALVTIVSAWLPARRAAAVDPMTALRCE